MDQEMEVVWAAMLVCGMMFAMWSKTLGCVLLYLSIRGIHGLDYGIRQTPRILYEHIPERGALTAPQTPRLTLTQPIFFN